MPGDQSQECLPCHQSDWRTKPPEANPPSKWVPSTDGEPNPQELLTRPPLFHPIRRARADHHPEAPLLTVCERCQREDRREPSGKLGANKRPPINPSGRRKELCTSAETKQHKVDWQPATVKHVETNHSRRKTIEALHIHLQRETSNLDYRRTLSLMAPTSLTPPPPLGTPT